jgi:L-alanine-DL-glutamate epimerase-like enolase superfamily enzyme
VAGYTAFKFRIGTEWKNNGLSVQKYSPYLRKTREAVGPRFDLMQESNMRLTLEQCLELCPVLEKLGFPWLEEPVQTRVAGALEDHLKIRDALKTVQASGGGSRVTRQEFKEWVDRDACDIVQPNVNVTGLTEAWHVARMANVKEKLCCPHNGHGGLTTVANAALVAAIPNHLVLELNQNLNPFKEEVFIEPLVVKRGDPRSGQEVFPYPWNLLERKHGPAGLSRPRRFRVRASSG